LKFINIFDYAGEWLMKMQNYAESTRISSPNDHDLPSVQTVFAFFFLYSPVQLSGISMPNIVRETRKGGGKKKVSAHFDIG
jgi:hypothetical protein